MILVTGGTGYIGSHISVELMQAGRDVLIADNLYNSKSSVLERVERIVGRRPDEEVDVRDTVAKQSVFSDYCSAAASILRS